MSCKREEAQAPVNNGATNTRAISAIESNRVNLIANSQTNQTVLLENGSTNQDSDLFKTAIETNAGFYLSTDAGRKDIYFKLKNGKVYSKNDVFEFLHIPRTPENANDRINSIKMEDGSLVICVGTSNYVIGRK